MLTREQFIENIKKGTEEAIKKYDKNSDKKLSKLEVASGFAKNKVPNPILATNSLFALYDKNNDNQLSFDEVNAAVLVQYVENAEKRIKDFIDFHLKGDTNKNDKISKEEAYKLFCKDCSTKDAEVLVNSLFEDVDYNKDKSITRDELREYYIKFYNIYPAE